MSYEDLDKREVLTTENYETKINSLIESIPEEKRTELALKEKTDKEGEEDKELLKNADDNLAILFNYFDNKEINKNKNKEKSRTLRSILNERMQENTMERLDWSEKSFKNVNFDRVHFQNIKLNNISISGEDTNIRDAKFGDNVDMSYANIEDAYMHRCEFNGENLLLDNTKFQAAFLNGSLFKNVTAENLTLIDKQMNLAKEEGYEKAIDKIKELERKQKEGASLTVEERSAYQASRETIYILSRKNRYTELTGVKFRDCTFNKLVLENTDLNKTNWKNTEIESAVIKNPKNLDKMTVDTFTKGQLLGKDVLLLGHARKQDIPTPST